MDAAACLDSVIITRELETRSARLPDYLRESRALVALMRSLKSPQAQVLQELAEAALQLCDAHSAGISIAEEADGAEVLRWRGTAGEWSSFLHGTIPRNASPCGVVMDRNEPLLMAHPERYFRYAMDGVPPLFETLLVPFEVDGRPAGTVWVIAHDETRRFDREDLRVLQSLSEFASVAYQVMQQQRQIGEALDRELAGTQHLQAISVGLVPEGGIGSLYEQILDAAMVIMRSQFASLQTIGRSGQLELLASRGLHPESARFWQVVGLDSLSSCGETLRAKQRVIVADVERDESLAGSPHLAELRRSGIRSVQSTPLVTRNGSLIGVVSTHWREPHTPSAGDLRMLDVLARETADLIERANAEAALREADRRKDEFLAVLAHELRNPLAPISTGIELLERAGDDSQVAGGIRSMMKRQMAHLSRLVDDLLDLSRITRGTIELQRDLVDVRMVMEAAAELARPLIEQRGHCLIVERAGIPLVVDGDLHRLIQVGSNLLGNAAKYMDPDGTIRLVMAMEGDDVVVRVRDWGIGISSDSLNRVFEMFAQLPEHRAQRGGGSGLGIGLALSRRLVDLHGGTLSASSEGRGLGSEFVLRLPRVRALPSVSMGTPKIQAAAVPRRILIVDDNVDAAMSLRAFLALEGHEIEIAHDGASALERIEGIDPDVLLLDIGLPEMDGYELARRVRSLPDGKDRLLVAVTGWGQDSDRRRARDAGFDVHLTKPINLELLDAAIANDLKRHSPRPN